MTRIKHKYWTIFALISLFGASSLANGEVTFEDAEDVTVKSLVFERARTKVLVAESSKFSQNANYYLARLKQFDYWITDQNQALTSLNKSATKPLFSIRR